MADQGSVLVAGFQFGRCRRAVLVVSALAAASLLAISAGAATRLSPLAIRTSLPIGGLGADGPLVAFSAGCGELTIWAPSTGLTRRVRKEVTDCSSTGSYGQVAVAGNRVVWVALEEHNHLYLGVHTVRAAKPSVVSLLYEAIDEDVGGLDADGALVAFSTQGGEYDSGPRATLWAGTSARVVPLTRGSGWMDWVVVDDDTIALGYRDGRVRLFRARGARLGSFDAGAVLRGLDLDEGRLLTLGHGRVQVMTPTGTVVLTRRVRGAGERELLDSRGELVAYRSGMTLRLLRLTDGRDVSARIPRTPDEYLHAHFGADGLVVAHLAEASRPGRGGVVRLLTEAELVRLLASSS